MYIIDEKEFDNVYRLMKMSFPEDEHRPYREQKALLDVDRYKVRAMKSNKDGNICAFATLWDFDRFLFIEHFAVDPSLRNCGLGSEIIKKLVAENEKPICLEVELPTNELSARRIAFYERNGFFLNDYPYVQPPLSKGRNYIPLKIMSTGRKLDESEFEHIKSTLYKYVYNQ